MLGRADVTWCRAGLDKNALNLDRGVVRFVLFAV